jgi:AbrB family looped-hinge helix DNA binding protein
MKVQVMSNGQVTIPPEVQQRLGLQEGDELLFCVVRKRNAITSSQATTAE